MRRGLFNNAASELNLPRNLWDKVYAKVKHTDQIVRFIWEVDGQNKKSLIIVCRVYGTGSQESVLVHHKTRLVKIPLSWRITMSEEQPSKPKTIEMTLKNGEKGIGIGEVLAEYFAEFYTDPYKRAEAAASLVVARRSDISAEAMEEAFWAGIYYAKKHPDNVVIEEKEPETDRPRSPGMWT